MKDLLALALLLLSVAARPLDKRQVAISPFHENCTPNLAGFPTWRISPTPYALGNSAWHVKGSHIVLEVPPFYDGGNFSSSPNFDWRVATYKNRRGSVFWQLASTAGFDEDVGTCLDARDFSAASVAPCDSTIPSQQLLIYCNTCTSDSISPDSPVFGSGCRLLSRTGNGQGLYYSSTKRDIESGETAVVRSEGIFFDFWYPGPYGGDVEQKSVGGLELVAAGGR